MVGLLFCLNYFVSRFVNHPAGPQQAKEETQPTIRQILPWLPEPAPATKLPCHIATAQKFIGVKETGTNTGPEVDMFLNWAGLGGGYYWCAAFAGYTFSQCKIKVPKSAWCPAYFTPQTVIYTRSKNNWPDIDQQNYGYYAGFYFAEKKRIAHIGIIEENLADNNYITCIEGNTSGSSGSRNGDGVYRIKRNKKVIYQISRYAVNS